MGDDNADWEERRLESLYSYAILDTGPDEAFDRITRLAQDLFETSIAVVSLVDRERQWFKSAQGLALAETPREVSFCADTISGSNILVVPDAKKDPNFKGNPLVTGAPHIRFYAGAPLRTYDGYNVGALCVMDSKPGALRFEQLDALQDLSRLVVDQLELRKITQRDFLTGALTRAAFLHFLDAELLRARRYGRPLSLMAVRLADAEVLHQRFGRPIADAILQEIGHALRHNVRTADQVGRGDSTVFAVLLPETGGAAAAQAMAKVDAALKRIRIEDAMIPDPMGLVPDCRLHCLTPTLDESESAEAILERVCAAVDG
jgi:diguanylate cyclase (GGDEF)-like protein